jgi:hypothetical protein
VRSSWKFTITEADRVHVEGLGCITGSATYNPGHLGSYWQPPDPAELEDIEFLAEGAPIPDERWDDPDFYDQVLLALSPVVERLFFQGSEELEEMARDFGPCT